MENKIELKEIFETILSITLFLHQT